MTTPRLSKLVLNGQAKAYPFVALAKQTGEVNDMLGKHPVQVR
ncbi:MAG TPA: hypothetical protein PKM20_10630 [Nitrosomonas sp.]|nr:hypothetical protein [Nitrosomonas sp.]